MEKIKQLLIKDINIHLIGLVGILLILFFKSPTFSNFLGILFGYIIAYAALVSVRYIIIPMFREEKINMDGMFSIIKGEPDIKKSKFQENMENMTSQRIQIRDEISKLKNNTMYNSSNINVGHGSSSITINNKTYRGNESVSVINGKVIIDGIEVTDTSNEKTVNIILHGDVRNVTIESSAKVTVSGDVKGNITAHNLQCGNVGGNVKGHNVNCGNVTGNVKGHNVKQK